jgi:tetratricopeptide (TPR) repeat protein
LAVNGEVPMALVLAFLPMGNESSAPPGDKRPPPAPAPTLTQTEAVVDGAPAARQSAVTPGMTLGRYRLRERIGEGGMGVVFAAYDPELDRTVAVKVLHPGLGGAGSRGEERLRREGQTMARMAHPNVIRVYDVGVQGDIVFVAMEYIAGGTLKSWLADAPRSADTILAAFAQAARGLAAAHDADLVHRDFKPSNVLVSDDGRVLVTDFGVARASIDPPSHQGDAPGVDPLGHTMTRAGSLVGTPAYMAPEQLQGRPVDGRADQFSFCVALWRALYGKAPYAGESWSELAKSTAVGKLVEPPASARVPGHVRAALERGLQPDPERRFLSVGALLQALDPDRRHRRRVRAIIAFGALAAVATVVAIGVERMRADPCAVDVDRFAGVWDADARTAVHSAFAATSAPYAEASFSETARQLDARRAAWETMRRQSCEATRVRKEQSDSMLDARATCLERSFADVAAFIGVLRHADATAVRGAAQAAASVGDVGPCSDVTALGRRAPLPADATRRRAISALETELASVRARVAAGQYQHADADANRLVDGARVTGYAPVLADALTVAGEVQDKLVHSQAAEKLFEESLLSAEAGGDDSVRFDDEVHLVSVVGYHLERDSDGQEHARRAQALLQRLGADRQREARLTRAVALAAWWNGRYEEARRETEHAVALQEAIDPHGADLARALHLDGVVLQDMKLDEASLAPLERARTIGEAALGAEHPVVAQIQQTIGGSLRRLGRYDAAAKEYLDSLTKIERAMGTDASEYAAALQNLGTLYLDQEKFGEAIEYLQRASDQLAKSLGADHSRVADALEILGSAYSKAGRASEAEATLNRAVAIHRARLGPNAPPTASSLRVLGDHFLRIGQPARAAASYEEAVKALTASQGEKSLLLARPLGRLGDAELALRQPARARDAYERAITIVAGDKSQAEMRGELEAALAKVSR